MSLDHHNNPQQFMLTDQSTKEVLTIRKVEVLLDVLRSLEDANSPDIYGVKLNVIDKIDKAINKL